ncbi:MAG: hydroxyacid dehydrogenase [Thermoprotei archaeon]|nr:MAG: hydroxyacid dehydrogenase [Thermoprotei archaeon]
MAKIAFLELEGWEEDIVKWELRDHDLILKHEKISDDIIDEISDVEMLSVFIYSKINGDILDRLPNLKAIMTRSTGYDHIDLEECKKRGIAVFNVPDYGSNTVAEFTFLLILSLVRKIRTIMEAKSGIDVHLELRGRDLKGKTIGIIGTGRIGSYVAKLAHAFGMRILAYDIYPRKELVERYGVKYVDLDTLLRNSDIVTLHLPYTKETHHIINRNNIKKMKKGALLINTARGGLIETEAIIEALDKGILGGVALDVIEGEWILVEEMDVVYGRRPFSVEELRKGIEVHILMNYPNVIITPHIAYNTWEALNRILETTINTIKGFLSGKELKNRII